MATEGRGRKKAYILPEGTLLRERYRILAVIGEGGFGITYAGRDEVLDTEVAVKEYYPADIATRTVTVSSTVSTWSEEDAEQYEKGRDGFLKEARTLAKFKNDPGIVSVYDFFSENNTAYIVMEYLSGENLRKALTKKGTMSFNESYDLLLPVMDSLEKIHAEGLIHRDVSPDNIQMGLDGRVKLMDFGAARAIPRDGERTMSMLLKPGYSPEEQYIGSEKQGPWTDVYSLCATLYRMITGMRPEDSLQRMLLDELKKPSELGIDINPEAENVLMKGLSIRPADRYQSVEELKKAFEEAKTEKPPEESGEKKSRKGIIIGVIAAVVAAAVIAGVILSKKPDPGMNTGPDTASAESTVSVSMDEVSTVSENPEAESTSSESAGAVSTSSESTAEQSAAEESSEAAEEETVDYIIAQAGEALFYGTRKAETEVMKFAGNCALRKLNVDDETLYTVTDLPYAFFCFPMGTGEAGIYLIYPDETGHLYAVTGKYYIQGERLKIIPEAEDPGSILASLKNLPADVAASSGSEGLTELFSWETDEHFLYSKEPITYTIIRNSGRISLGTEQEPAGYQYDTELTSLAGSAGQFGKTEEQLLKPGISAIRIDTLEEGGGCTVYLEDGSAAEDAVLKSLYPSIRAFSISWRRVARLYNGREEVFDEPGNITSCYYFNTAPFGFVLAEYSENENAIHFFQNPVHEK